MKKKHKRKMPTIFDEIKAERVRQDAKWGVQHHHPTMWLTILSEEVGEVAQEVCNIYFNENDYTTYGPAYREELIQAAAVIVAAIEDLDGD